VLLASTVEVVVVLVLMPFSEVVAVAALPMCVKAAIA
jgi:hypothetical protein